MMKNEDMRFLIRNELANEFDNILKQKIGDRMHLQDMLSPEYFEEKRWVLFVVMMWQYKPNSK